MAHVTTQPCQILMKHHWDLVRTEDLITCEAEWCEKLEPTELLWHVKQTTTKKAVTMHHFTETSWQSAREERGTNSQQTSHLCVASSQQARAGREPRGGNRPGPVQVGCTSHRPVIHWMTFTWGLKTTGRVTRWLGKSIERAVCMCVFVCVCLCNCDWRQVHYCTKWTTGQKSSLKTEKKGKRYFNQYGVKKKKKI